MDLFHTEGFHTEENPSSGDAIMDLSTDSRVLVSRVNCLFHQNQPGVYEEFSSCNGEGFDGLARLREHLWRHHVRHEDQEKMSEGTGDKTTGQNESKRHTKKRRCPQLLSLRQYERLHTRKRKSRNGSPRTAWLEMYRRIFDEMPCPPPNPFNPSFRQLMSLVRSRSPEFLAWCRIHNKEDTSVEAKLDLMLEIGDWLSETGGYPSSAAPPSSPQLGVQERLQHQDDSEMSASYQHQNGANESRDSGFATEDNDEVTEEFDGSSPDGDDGYFASMTNDVWEPRT